MSPVRTVYVPCFGSQFGSSQRDEPRQDQIMYPKKPPSRDKGGNSRCKVKVRGEKSRFHLKVKFPKLNNSALSKKATKKDNTPRWMVEGAANKIKTTVSQGGAGTDSDSVGGDVFLFTENPTSTAINSNEKVKLAVLRTISKMLEENQLIRQRLVTASQAN
ncbi:hypothetical protein PFLUV_G00120480 [Perca fluviatilis]|uniref:Uncharacterized protein n=1 Tax=Perca fluviatilis TaxID=8168 RepID=A0A6A5E6K1_PERFL|nr:hypothetical protein PFLUV_G00120480 [Perca fluviatilis]